MNHRPDIHESIARDVFGDKVWQLRCRECGATETMNTEQGAIYLSGGWPKCCGYTRRLEEAENDPAD